MNNLRRANLKGKRVLVRCDLNVPIDEKGNIEDDFRLRKLASSIKYLRNAGAKIIIIAHLGEPNGKDLKFSLRPETRKLWEIVNGRVKFLDETLGRNVNMEIGRMQKGDVIVLENLRFYKEEKANDDKFAHELAKLADVFVQDAFGVCHREHASIIGVPKFLPSYPGLLLEEEIRVLSNVLVKPDRPLVSIIGGVKIATKAKVIKTLLKKSDYVLIGGKIANSLLTAKGICVKDALTEEDENLMEEVKGIDLDNTKLQLPVDGIMALSDMTEEYVRVGAACTLGRDEGIFDIGPDTIEKFRMILGEARTVIWNGPLGYFEKEKFSKGTLEIARIIARNNDRIFSVIGGGETVEAVHKLRMENGFDYISCGGSAMLDFLAGEDLPGIRALEENSKRLKNDEN